MFGFQILKLRLKFLDIWQDFGTSVKEDFSTSVQHLRLVANPSVRRMPFKLMVETHMFGIDKTWL